MRIGRFHVLTDFHKQQRFSHAELTSRVLSGGADTVQFRQKQGVIRDKLHEAERVVEICNRAGVPLIVDDMIDLAMAVEADGVHLGQSDFPIPYARKILGEEMIIGGTATTREQAVQIEEDGGDYVGFGPVFPTDSKDNPASVKGLRGLGATCDAVDVPVIAIGGINSDRVSAVLEAGAYGVAVMSAVIQDEDPAGAAELIRTEIDDHLSASS